MTQPEPRDRSAAADPALHDRYANAVLGSAAGDAWGYQVEFVPYDRIDPRPYPRPAGVWRISDDTQMLLATHRALHRARDPHDVDEVAAALIAEYTIWLHDPDNDRAPGIACQTSLRTLEQGGSWDDGSPENSAGCGGVMRQLPAAFLPSVVRRGVSVLQTVVTHRHPKAVVSALLLSDAITAAVAGRSGDLVSAADARLAELERGMPEDWRGDAHLMVVLARITDDPHRFLLDGLEDRYQGRPTMREAFTAAARRREAARDDEGWTGDPCAGIGEGWDAATATALALLVADRAADRDDPVGAMAWAATSNGDSDSIAAVAGAVMGASMPAAGAWVSAGLEPRFEARYERELADACAEGPAA